MVRATTLFVGPTHVKILHRTHSLTHWYNPYLRLMTANHVLTEALRPGINGIPKSLFDKAKGIMIISIVELGFIFSGTMETGILLAKKSDGSWSLPSAVGLGGMGWGFLVGGSVKDVIIFYFDVNSLIVAASDAGVKLSGQAEITLGAFGRSSSLGVDVSNTGISGSFAVALTRAGFLGLNINGSMVRPRSAANAQFYGKEALAKDIIFNDAVTYPDGKATLLDVFYQKLALLSQGATTEEDVPADVKASALSAVEAASANAASMEGVEQVDAAAEAAKEGSS